MDIASVVRGNGAGSLATSAMVADGDRTDERLSASREALMSVPSYGRRMEGRKCVAERSRFAFSYLAPAVPRAG